MLTEQASKYKAKATMRLTGHGFGELQVQFSRAWLSASICLLDQPAATNDELEVLNIQAAMLEIKIK